MVNNAAPLKQEETFWQKMRGKSDRGENTWDHARFILADVPLDGKELKKILPFGMWPDKQPAATLFIADYGNVSFPLAPYHEAAMLVHVHTLLGSGRHCCWILVDDDTALILGREMLGYPKKMGAFEFNEKEGNIQASVSRRGVRVMSMEGKRGLPQEPKPPVFDFKTFHVGGMGQLLALNPVWMFRPHELIHEYYNAEIKLTLNGSEFDPVKRLVAGEPGNGRIVVMDIPGDGYIVPVGYAGPGWFGRTFDMRFR